MNKFPGTMPSLLLVDLVLMQSQGSIISEGLWCGPRYEGGDRQGQYHLGNSQRVKFIVWIKASSTIGSIRQYHRKNCESGVRELHYSLLPPGLELCGQPGWVAMNEGDKGGSCAECLAHGVSVFLGGRLTEDLTAKTLSSQCHLIKIPLNFF